MMDFALYQIIIMAFGGILILRVIIRFLLKKKTLRELIVATIIWGSMIFLGYLPTPLNLNDKFSEEYLSVITISLIILFYSTFSNMIKTERLENSVTRVIRRKAIEDALETYDTNNKNL